MNALRFGVRTAAVAAALAIALAAAPGHRVTRDAPPPAHTGGFGEPDCTACHMQARPNEGSGSITVGGVPDAYAPGRQYTLEVSVSHRGLSGGGYEISARFEDGRQAGTFTVPAAEAERSGVMTEKGVQYAHHLGEGSVAEAADEMKWTLHWTAPAQGSGRVIFHAAGNASNDDLSPFGDWIYLRELVSRPDSSLR